MVPGLSRKSDEGVAFGVGGWAGAALAGASGEEGRHSTNAPILKASTATTAIQPRR